MKSTFINIYEKCVLRHPLLSLGIVFAIMAFFICHIPKFQLEASADSLVLENDADLRYHRQITENYGSNDILVVTYTPKNDIFSESSITAIKNIRNEFRKLANIDSVTSIIDVPLLLASKVSLSEIGDENKIKTIEDGVLETDLIRDEFANNPLYQGRLLSSNAKTTAILLNLSTDKLFKNLQNQRYKLQEKKNNGSATTDELNQLADVSRLYKKKLTELKIKDDKLVADVRNIIDDYNHHADIFLGGVPMIVSDMITFIKDDLVIFGLGVSVCMIISLAVIFRRLRWVLMPMMCCGATVLTMIGYLGFVDWRVTVISSNFISLMIILTMSLTIHLVQRYLEVRKEYPEADQHTLIIKSVESIITPCFYTTLTTMVAFISLLVSGIRPVMDFGMMMSIGLILSFVLVFVLYPCVAVLLNKIPLKKDKNRGTPHTFLFAKFTEQNGVIIIIFTCIFAVLSVIGINNLKVENRFIDYFREDTEINQGMRVIDQQLGGTTPLDIIIDFKDEFLEEDFMDEFKEDDLMLGFGEEENINYWYSDVYTIEQIEKIHDYLQSLPEIGEVVSLATLTKITTKLNKDNELDNFDLSLIFKKSPPEVRKLLIDPYVTEDNRQVRITTRIIESDKKLSRNILMNKTKKFLIDDMGYSEDQIHFTNMYVLYNNMLQSLFNSQIQTIGVVFLGIFLMFVILFRSLKLALIAAIPNILPVVMVLGIIGWLKISLDMMTITIASITIGIAVDDTIHYVHRFKKEFRHNNDYILTMNKCHTTIGKAMYYTSITITLGFAILVLSSFIPTIYFGIFTGFAMLVALIANLTLLPRLLIIFKPLGTKKNI